MRFVTRLLCFTCLLYLSVHTYAFAENKGKVLFKDVTLTTSETHLLLFALLENTNQHKLEEALHSGIPMEFTFQVELTHVRENWTDDELLSTEFTHILKYDALKEQYLLQLEEQRNRTVTFAELPGAMAVMNEINGLKIIELNKLKPNNSYVVRMKASLFEKTLPMNLHYVIPFISLGNVETDWHSIEFTY